MKVTTYITLSQIATKGAYTIVHARVAISYPGEPEPACHEGRVIAACEGGSPLVAQELLELDWSTLNIMCDMVRGYVKLYELAGEGDELQSMRMSYTSDLHVEEESYHMCPTEKGAKEL